MMKVLLVFAAIALVALAVEDAAGVKELDEVEGAPTYTNGGDSTHPDYFVNSKEGTGYYKNIANFVGPKYGLPGYKESHDWENAYDIMSPLVFDYRFYRAFISEFSDYDDATAEKMSEEDLRTDWEGQINKKENPNCPQGHIWFNANTFYSLNSEHNTFKMGGASCTSIMQVYLNEGIFTGMSVATVKNGDTDAFATIGTRIFNMDNAAYSQEEEAEAASAFYQVQSGRFVQTPPPDEARVDNTFTPARHMTIVFWLKFGTFADAEAPNAELFAYGARNGDNYFRTGVGCLVATIEAAADAVGSKCYFIFVMGTTTTVEYFHTYNDNNFKELRAGLAGHQWAHVLMTLTTNKPKECPRNALGSGCEAILELYVNKLQQYIVDWTDGADTNRAGGWPEEEGKPTHWNVFIADVWTDQELNIQGLEWIRRFWLSPPNNCKKPESEDIDTNQCGNVQKNGLTWQFPWFGAYMAGVWVCDFAAIPSGVGGFGEKKRRVLAMNAFYDVMSDTKGIACSHEGGGAAAVNSHGTTQAAVDEAKGGR